MKSENDEKSFLSRINMKQSQAIQDNLSKYFS